MNISYETIKPFEPFGVPKMHDFMAGQVIEGVIEVVFGSICEQFRFEIVDQILKNTITGIMQRNMREAGADDPYCFLITVEHDGTVVEFILHYSFTIPGNFKKHIGLASFHY